MRDVSRGVPVVIAAALVAVALATCSGEAAGQAQPQLGVGHDLRSDYKAPRTTDGKPDLGGIWQAVNSAHLDLEAHGARSSPLPQLGAIGALPADVGVVEGGAIPYKPAALAKKKDNLANRLALDPVVKCFMPGVPRATYMPFPFQIVQSPEHIMIAYELPGASRTIFMDPKAKESPADYYMGWSRGRWEGETLVVDVNGFNDQTWFDQSGNFHSAQLHVVERYTRISPNHIWYEATIEDPEVFTRPWKIAMPLYRRIEKFAQLIEFNCIEFAEDLMLGHLYRKTP